jgi:hypothetical protein
VWAKDFMSTGGLGGVDAVSSSSEDVMGNGLKNSANQYIGAAMSNSPK